MTITASRLLLRALSLLVGLGGSTIFVLAVLCAVAVPVAAADLDPACFPAPGGLFSPCADLSVARVDDLR